MTRSRRQRSNTAGMAFTTVELMVAIAIVVVLIGIVMWGLGASGNMGKTKQTRSTMDNLKNMLQELKVRRQPNKFYINGSLQAPTTDTKDDFWNGIVPAPSGSMSQDAQRYSSDAVLNTQLLMKMLRSVPENDSVIKAFPSDQMLKASGSANVGNLTTLPPDSEGRVVVDPPMLVDGWGNPIIYVPRGGLSGVKVLADPDPARVTVRVTSAGVEPEFTGTGRVPVPAGAQPFFASAGPDGIFDRLPGPDGQLGTIDDIPCGADNVYSFEN